MRGSKTINEIKYRGHARTWRNFWYTDGVAKVVLLDGRLNYMRG